MTSNAWPMASNSAACILPPQMDKACKSFEQFYHSKHSGRRLDWQLALGNADVLVRFKDKSHELNVSTLALVILLLFEHMEDGEELTYMVSRSIWHSDNSSSHYPEITGHQGNDAD